MASRYPAERRQEYRQSNQTDYATLINYSPITRPAYVFRDSANTASVLTRQTGSGGNSTSRTKPVAATPQFYQPVHNYNTRYVANSRINARSVNTSSWDRPDDSSAMISNYTFYNNNSNSNNRNNNNNNYNHNQNNYNNNHNSNNYNYKNNNNNNNNNNDNNNNNNNRNNSSSNSNNSFTGYRSYNRNDTYNNNNRNYYSDRRSDRNTREFHNSNNTNSNNTNSNNTNSSNNNTGSISNITSRNRPFISHSTPNNIISSTRTNNISYRDCLLNKNSNNATSSTSIGANDSTIPLTAIIGTSNNSTQDKNKEETTSSTSKPSENSKVADHSTGSTANTKSDTCSICLMNIDDKASLECGHCFCYECLVKWCSNSETCPLCRSKITKVEENGKALPNQRMIGIFKCTCGNTWKSTYSYHGIKQGCKKCNGEVEAMNYSPLRNANDRQLYNPFAQLSLLNTTTTSTHKQELCGMCKLLGKDCSRQEKLNELDDDDLLGIIELERYFPALSLIDRPMRNFLVPSPFMVDSFDEDEDRPDSFLYDFTEHDFSDIDDSWLYMQSYDDDEW